MKLKFALQVAALSCSLMATGIFAGAQDGSQQTAPDNSRVNRDQSQPTADQQKVDRSDRDITKQIRESVMKDKSLSTYAHNVKIISQDGMVTLRGVVRSEDEKRTIEAKAAEVVGQDKV
ncbi:MAG: BON domain-containing protein, partial [Mycobacterium sp.]